MIEKIKRNKKVNKFDVTKPKTIDELLQKYDLSNSDIYDYLDYLADNIQNSNNDISELDNDIADLDNDVSGLDHTVQTLNNDFSTFVNQTNESNTYSTGETKIGTWINRKTYL